MTDVPVVHAVTNDEILLRPGFLRRAKGVMKALGARGAVHLRSSLLPSPTLYALTRELLELSAETLCWCVVGDRVDIALASGAHAVQLNSKSIPVSDVQRIAPALRIGASVHSAIEAWDAEAAGADWCVAGHVFETQTHPGIPRRESHFISQIAGEVTFPVIAIGGVLPQHVRSLLLGGAYGVAAIRGIWEAENSELAASRYLSEYDGNGIS